MKEYDKDNIELKEILFWIGFVVVYGIIYMWLS